MKELVFGAPNAKQDRVMRSEAKHIGFGGARGGGKSWMVQTKSTLLCLKYPGIRICIVRRTFPQLEENHINVMRPMLKGVAAYNQQKKRFSFPNGSSIKFNYCRNDADTENFQGQEYDVIFIDEATQLSEDQIKRIGATCRGTNGLPKRIYYTCNPGGQGHEFIKRIFIDREYLPTEKPEDYEFVQSLLSDNEALMREDPEYQAYLEGLPDKLKRAWLYGEWDIFEGQFFEEFQKTPNRSLCEAAGISQEEALARQMYTHVIEPFEIPPTWPIYRSFDFGYAKPFSCDWWAVDYDGRAYLIGQLYGCTQTPNEGVKWHPDKIFSEISRIEREHRWLKGKAITGVADPSIWDKSRGESINDFAVKHGVYFTPGDNARLPGWMQVHYRMAFDESGRPRMYFFSSCKHAIRTVPLLMYSETDTEDLDTTQEDHFADSMRYFCMSRPVQPVRIYKKPERGPDPLNLYDSLM